MAVEMQDEGLTPLPADAYRLRASVHAGGARIEGVWAAQEEILLESVASEANSEQLLYQHIISAKPADPMKVGMGPRQLGGKRSLEQRRRGQLAMRAMLEHHKVPWQPTKTMLREVKATQAELSKPSRLEARAAGWLHEGSVGSKHAAAAKLQAAQRGKKAKKEVEKKRAEKKVADAAKGRASRPRPRTAHN